MYHIKFSSIVSEFLSTWMICCYSLKAHCSFIYLYIFIYFPCKVQQLSKITASWSKYFILNHKLTSRDLAIVGEGHFKVFAKSTRILIDHSCCVSKSLHQGVHLQNPIFQCSVWGLKSSNIIPTEIMKISIKVLKFTYIQNEGYIST